MNEIQREYEEFHDRKATYRVDSSDYHFLAYVKWLEKQINQLRADLAADLAAALKRVGELEGQTFDAVANRLSRDLPYHIIVSICIEKDAAWVELSTCETDEIIDGADEIINDADQTLAEQVEEALQIALRGGETTDQ